MHINNTKRFCHLSIKVWKNIFYQ